MGLEVFYIHTPVIFNDLYPHVTELHLWVWKMCFRDALCKWGVSLGSHHSAPSLKTTCHFCHLTSTVFNSNTLTHPDCNCVVISADWGDAVYVSHAGEPAGLPRWLTVVPNVPIRRNTVPSAGIKQQQTTEYKTTMLFVSICPKLQQNILTGWNCKMICSWWRCLSLTW